MYDTLVATHTMLHSGIGTLVATHTMVGTLVATHTMYNGRYLSGNPHNAVQC